jgi:hypothetical protein
LIHLFTHLFIHTSFIYLLFISEHVFIRYITIYVLFSPYLFIILSIHSLFICLDPVVSLIAFTVLRVGKIVGYQSSIPGGDMNLSLLHSVQTGSGAHPGSYVLCTGLGLLPRGSCGLSEMLNTHLHVLQRLRKTGAIPPQGHHGSYWTAVLTYSFFS